MRRAVMALGGAALALLMVSALSLPAEARRNGGHGWHGGGSVRSFSGGGSFNAGSSFNRSLRFYSGPSINRSLRSYSGPGPIINRSPRFHGGHAGHHRRFHRRLFIGVPAYYGGDYYYADDYGYGDNGCYWLRRRAISTGSSYWWNRYQACIGADYDGYED